MSITRYFLSGLLYVAMMGVSIAGIVCTGQGWWAPMSPETLTSMTYALIGLMAVLYLDKLNREWLKAKALDALLLASKKEK